MDFDSSSKFINSLAKFLQSLCNGYVEFDNGVEVIGHIYLNVDTGKKIDYILNEKVCKTNENSVTFISNSFHAQPAEKPKPAEKPTPVVPPDPPSQNDDSEIILMDEPEADEEYSYSSQFISHNTPTHHNHNTQHGNPRLPGASKRPHSQSIPSHRPSQNKVPKYNNSTPSLSFAPHSAKKDSSFRLSNVQTSLAAESSGLSQVDPPSSHPSNEQTDVKPVLDKDMNVVSVKQECDPSLTQHTHGGLSNTYDNQKLEEANYYSQAQSYQDGSDYYGEGGGHDEMSAMYGDAGPSVAGGDVQVFGNHHEMSKNFPCDFCPKRFKDSRSLLDHRNSAHLRHFPHSCPKCGKGFVYKRSQRRHSTICNVLLNIINDSDNLTLEEVNSDQYITKPYIV